MGTKALYAGSFDPLTLGHVDIIERASRLFEGVYVAVAVNTTKTPLFSDEEKVQLLHDSLAHLDNITIVRLEPGRLTIDLAHDLSCQVLLRGCRNPQDYEYETSIAMMNKLQDRAIETVLLMSDEKYRFVSSSIVKETARFGGNVSAVVPKPVNQALKEKFQYSD
ncbi:MAG: pantetheine-phosphate adenylyltransferase [Aerococcus sp.]|nr:pantetheine-phosphate adenylyltransferase [Aerococcus sp.]